MSEVEWGTAEYFEQRGEKRGEKRVAEKLIESFKRQGMSKKEIQYQLNEAGISYDYLNEFLSE